MKTITRLLAVLAFAGWAGGVFAQDTLTVDGTEWAQVDVFTGLTWLEVNAVCPSGLCIEGGTLNGFDVTGLRWASADQVNALFNYYIGSTVLGPGPDLYTEISPPWIDDFYNDGWRPTQELEGLLVLTLGMTATESDPSDYYVGGLQRGSGDPFDPNGFEVTLAYTDDPHAKDAVRGSTGVWLYRPNSVVFSAIGDYGTGSTAAGDVAALVDSWNPDFIIGAGDNRYGSSTFDDVVGRFYCGYLTNAGIGPSCAGGASPSNAFFPVPGNHDYTDGGGINEYLNYFTLPIGTSGNERYYDFVMGNVHFFGLDSQGALGSIPDMDAQKAWLQAQLAASTSPFKVVFLHHPPYSSSSVHGSTTAMQWPFSAWGANAVIAGHDHTYERIEKGGIPHFVNGLGGSSIYGIGTPIDSSLVRYNANYGAMRITADQEEMTFEFRDIDDTVVDSFTANGESIPPPPAGTVESRILFGADDVEENNDNGAMYIDSSDIELVREPLDGSNQTVGLRFQYLFIPRRATIDTAYLEFTVDEVQSEATNVVIRAQLADSAQAFSSAASDVTSRPLTSASVPWSIPAWDTVGANQQSPDIAAVLQEIIDRGGWSVNNSIVLVIDGTGRRTAESYEGSPGKAAVLHVEYSKPPTVGC